MQFVLAVQNDREWRRLCSDVLQRPTLADDPAFASVPQRVANRPALCAEITATLCTAGRHSVMARLQQHGIACGALNSVADLLAHPQLALASGQTPDGKPYALPAFGYALSVLQENGDLCTEGGGAELRCPRLGEHSDAIKNEFAL